jgi:hypothetical protein
MIDITAAKNKLVSSKKRNNLNSIRCFQKWVKSAVAGSKAASAIKRRMLKRTAKRMARFKNRILQKYVHSIAGCLNDLQHVDVQVKFEFATEVAFKNARTISLMLNQNQNCFINQDNLHGN